MPPTPRLMMVDDEADFLDLCAKRFKKRGYDIIPAGSGFAALEILSKQEVDVVVLDVKMPGMDGIQTLKEIKKRHSEVEVILLTGHGSVESGIQGMSHGAYDYVMKPFQLDDLLFKIDKAFERKKLRQEGGE
mgnify:CR=1 FL=1